MNRDNQIRPRNEDDDFLNYDAINKRIQGRPLDEDEKLMIRNHKRRKTPVHFEETMAIIEDHKELLAAIILENRAILREAGLTKEQILAWENDPTDKRTVWEIYEQTEVGKAELSLTRKMQKEEDKRWLKANPDGEGIPF